MWISKGARRAAGLALFLLIVAANAAAPLHTDKSIHTNSTTEINTDHPNRAGLPLNYPVQRVIIDASQSPWRVIGNLSIAGRQFCSATLIGIDTVVTAAHCLWNRERNDWYQPQFIHFLAGYQRGDYVAHARAKNIAPNRHYRPKGRQKGQTDLEKLSQDWALVQLESPLGKTLGYLPLKQVNKQQRQLWAQTREPLLLAGYRSDTREALSLDNGCQLLPTKALTQLFLSNTCSGFSGDSGGPLLWQDQTGQVFLLGIHVGRQHRSSLQPGNDTSLAIPVSAFHSAICSGKPQSSCRR